MDPILFWRDAMMNLVLACTPPVVGVYLWAAPLVGNIDSKKAVKNDLANFIWQFLNALMLVTLSLQCRWLYP